MAAKTKKVRITNRVFAKDLEVGNTIISVTEAGTITLERIYTVRVEGVKVFVHTEYNFGGGHPGVGHHIFQLYDFVTVI